MEDYELIRKGKLKGLVWVKNNFYESLKSDEKEMLDDAILDLDIMLGNKTRDTSNYI